MAKPINAVRGFVRLTHYNSTEILISIDNIAAVRSVNGNTFVFIIHSPFTSMHTPQDLHVLENHEDVIRLISESSY